METLSNNVQENPYATKWQNLGGEQEKPKLNPEELRETAKMIEKLGDMGADSRILENPAFAKTLNSLLDNYGMRMSTKNSISVTGEEDKYLGITYTGEKGDSYHHDRGNIRFAVGSKGELTIESACVDSRDKIMGKDIFDYYDGPTVDNNVEVKEMVNVSQSTKFEISPDNMLAIDTKGAYEKQYNPRYQSTSGKNFGYYYSAAYDETRRFDSSGIEQSREIVDYESRSLQSHDGISPFLGQRSWFESQPAKASFNLLPGYSGSRLRPASKIKERTMLFRNEDGTVKVQNVRDGKNVTIEKAPIYSEYGTAELQVMPIIITEAHEKARNSQ